MEKIILKCPKHKEEFSLDEMRSSTCPHCGEWVDRNALLIIRSREKLI